MRIILIALFISLCIIKSHAQSTQNAQTTVTVSGRCVDEGNHPVPFVRIWASHAETPEKLIKADLCREDGTFRLSLAPKSEYIITGEMMSYKKASKTIATDTANINLGDMLMAPDPILLKTVTVRPVYHVTADKIIFNFENDPERSTANMTRMLEKTPLIGFTPEGKMFVEDERKRFLVVRNGRVDALFNTSNMRIEDIMNKLVAMGFTTIEILRDPPSKYGEYDYVINIKADKTKRLFGAVGSTQGYYNMAFGMATLSLGTNASADIIRFAASGGSTNTHTPKTKTETWERTFDAFNDTETSLHQLATSSRTGESYNGGIKFSQDINKRQFVNFDLSFSSNDSRNISNTISERITGSETINYESLFRGYSHSRKWQAAITYQLDFAKKTRVLNISYLGISSPSTNDDLRRDIYSQNPGINTSLLFKGTTKDITHRFQMDYVDSFSKFNLASRLGYLATDYKRVNTVIDQMTDTHIDALRNRLRQSLGRIDGYARVVFNPNKYWNINANITGDYLPDNNATTSTIGNITQAISQKGLLFSTGAGVRYLFSANKKVQNITVTNPDGTTYTVPNFMPGAEVSTALNYRLEQLRPNIMQLIDYASPTNPNYSIKGNPDLVPETYHTFELNLKLPVHYPMPLIKYTFSNNKIVNIWKNDINTGNTVQSYENAGKYQNLSLELTQMGFMKLPIQSFITGNYRKIEQLNHDNNTYVTEDYSIFVRTSYSKTIVKVISTFWTLSYQNNWGSGLSYSKTTDPFRLSLRIANRNRMNKGNWNYDVTFHNLLNWKTRSERFINTDNFEQRRLSTQNVLYISFNLRYRFGKFLVKDVRTGSRRAEIGGFSDRE